MLRYLNFMHAIMKPARVLPDVATNDVFRMDSEYLFCIIGLLLAGQEWFSLACGPRCGQHAKLKICSLIVMREIVNMCLKNISLIIRRSL